MVQWFAVAKLLYQNLILIEQDWNGKNMLHVDTDGSASCISLKGHAVIIDCHGHYTTAPKALEAWRKRQIEGIKQPALMPKVSELKISDDELRESIETN